MPKESHLEIKVGMFVLAAILALTVFIWSINSTASFGKGKPYKVIFEFANGLQKDAPVRVAGVDQGIVRNINLYFDRQDGKTKAEVAILIRKDLEIPTDSIVMINQLGLLGEKYIEVFPGQDTRSFYQEGQTIRGRDPVAQELISQKIMDVAKGLDQSIAGFNTIITDGKNQGSISATLQHLSSISAGVDDMIANVRKGKGTVGRLFFDDTLYDDIQGFTSQIKKDPWKLLYRPK